MNRREALRVLTAAALAGVVPRIGAAADDDLYDIGRFGNVRVLHLTDTHAQLQPVFFREPSVNIGIGSMLAKPPHLVGRAFLEHFGMEAGGRAAHAFTFLDYEEAAHRYGRMGGFAHLKTLIERLRGEAGNSVLLDGGDLWQGSGLADALQAADMVDAGNLLGIEAMTGHWEFTYGEKTLRRNLERFKGEFLAQNVFLTEEAAFNDAPAFDPASGRVFKPAIIRQVGERRIAIIGQAMPYVPVAHPKRFVPDWTFGIRDAELQKVVDDLRGREKVDAVLLLSHNGMDVDLNLASRVSGIDVVLGGHTHDAVPRPVVVANPGGTDTGHQCRIEWQVSGRSRPRCRQGYDQGRALSAAAGLREPAEAGSRDAGADRSPARALYRAIRRGCWRPRTSSSTAAATSMVRWIKSSATRFARSWMRRSRCRRIPLGRNRAPRSADHDGGRALRNRDHLSGGLRSGNDRKPAQGHHGRHLRQSLQSRPYYQQGGDMVRIGGMDYVCEPAQAMGQRISDMRLDDGRTIEADKSYR
jgi:sulfur-oxidizing protein SoxB